MLSISRGNLILRNKAIGRAYDYFAAEDIKHEEDYIIVQTQYPDDTLLQQVILSFGKDVEVVGPEHLRKSIQDEAKGILAMYKD